MQIRTHPEDVIIPFIASDRLLALLVRADVVDSDFLSLSNDLPLLVDQILLEAGEGVVMDYLQWQGLRSALPHLAKPFADEAFSFQSAVYGVAVQPPRECTLLRHLFLFVKTAAVHVY